MCNNAGASPISVCPRIGFHGGLFCERYSSEPLVCASLNVLLCMRRLLYANYTISRPHGEQGRYMSIPHHHRGEVQFLGRLVFVRKVHQSHARTQCTLAHIHTPASG